MYKTSLKLFTKVVVYGEENMDEKETLLHILSYILTYNALYECITYSKIKLFKKIKAKKIIHDFFILH